MGVKILYTTIEFILSHFSHQLQLFPRKMMTAKSNGQFTVTSIKEIIEKCKEAKLKDCRINAYPEYTEYRGIVRQPPDFVFIDLDLTNFNNDKNLIERTLKRTLNKINKLGANPTVIWSGNGYHIYLPLEAMVLDQIDIFSKDKFPSLFKSSFSRYHGYSVSELFLKFAKNYLSNGKSDTLHHPKYKTCLIRIPNTYNSKCVNKGLGKEESKVKIIQEWDGKILPIQFLLKDFRRWIVQEELNQKRRNYKLNSRKISFPLVNNSSKIDWIEKLLETPVEDYRHYCLWRIIGPYLLNVRRVSGEEAANMMENWLQKCNKINKLGYEPKDKIRPIIKDNKGYLPISFEKLSIENKTLYQKLLNNK